MAPKNFKIRHANRSDLVQWSEMRNKLWPASQDHHRKELEIMLSETDSVAFVAEGRDGHLVGFSEASIRKYANGCTSSPVPFVEGCWVEPPLRNQHIGKSLIDAIEAWASEAGFNELGSDCEISNTASIKAHQSWGFQETERVVNFRKDLSSK